MSDRLRLVCVVGARPNFMKIAPLMRAFAKRGERIQATLLHTGQHYDEAMKHAFFRQLDIPEPDIDLEVGSGSHAQQTAAIMQAFEPVIADGAADAVLVVGDVNSTIACALVAAKLGVPVIHVEAGLRSYDRAMPEEINRVLTDQISELLYTTEAEAEANLAREGIDPARVHHVGNVMIDTLLHNRGNAPRASDLLADLLPDEDIERFGLLTLHRPSNVDHPEVLARLVKVLAEISQRMPLLFPVHPRTRARLHESGLLSRVRESNIHMLEPLGYLPMLGLMQEAHLVLTDSGGIQEETTALGVPCLTLRDNTERPITLREGTNTLVGPNPARIRQAFDGIMRDGGKAGRVPALWDGKTAERIAEHLLEWWRDRNDPARAGAA